MSDEPSNESLVPNNWPTPPTEVNEPQPDPSDVVPDGGCKPLAPDQPARPTKTFIPPPPKPKPFV